MSYSQYDADYLFDHYYFQPPRSSHVANFLPQGDFYGWSSEGVCATSQPPEMDMHWRDPPVKVDLGSMNHLNVLPSTHQNIFEMSAEETRMHSCPTCHKQYCRKSTLKIHMKQHLGHRPFSCQVFHVIFQITRVCSLLKTLFLKKSLVWTASFSYALANFQLQSALWFERYPCAQIYIGLLAWWLQLRSINARAMKVSNVYYRIVSFPTFKSISRCRKEL